MASVKAVSKAQRSPNWFINLKKWVQQYPYRLLSALVVIVAIVFTMLVPQDQLALQMPEPWSYALAADNFSQGKWVLTTDEFAAARTQVRIAGARLTQYVEIAPDTWAFRQSPGHPLQLAFFQIIARQSRLSNISLALVAATVVFLVLASWKNEKAAFIGVTLLLWTPITLLALHYTNMETFVSGMWPLISGTMLLLYERMDRHKKPQWTMRFLLFLAGLSAGWTVLVRITSLPLAFVLFGYGVYLIWAKQAPIKGKRRRKGKRKKGKRPMHFDKTSQQHLVALCLGGLFVLGILLAYNWLTFGKFLDNGYLYPSNYEAHNLWSDDPLTEVPGGVKTWLAGGTLADIIMTQFVHIRLWLRPAIRAWPLWPLALWGLLQLIRTRKIEQSSWFIFLWLFFAYLPFTGIIFFGVTRALAEPYDQSWGYFVPSRYLYPMMLPFVWCLAFVMNRWSNRWAFALLGLYVVGSSGLFLLTLAN